MHFNIFSRCSPALNSAARIVDFIKEDTTPEAFDEECRKYKYYKLSAGSPEHQLQTALGAAASVGNIALVDHIAKNDFSLLYLSTKKCQTPLHCAIECKNRKNGYEIVKKLISFEAPINIVRVISPGNKYSLTPLETALIDGNFQSAAFLFRNGGVVTEEIKATNPKVSGNLEIVKKIVQSENKKAVLFKLQHQKVLPNEITSQIMSLYAQLI